jgi:3D (Asp-Asp-Asp) domain-containing protein
MAQVRGKNTNMAKKNSRKANLVREISFWIMAVFVSVLFAICAGRFLPDIGNAFSRKIGESALEKGFFEVTGYCNCEECCGWERDKDGRPVFNYGRMAGKPKIIGQTSSGTMAKRGTLAADPRVFKVGTKLKIPGYGTGTVEDIGGAIKGRHIDLWFPSHEEAKRWGKRYLKIEVL